MSSDFRFFQFAEVMEIVRAGKNPKMQKRVRTSQQRHQQKEKVGAEEEPDPKRVPPIKAADGQKAVTGRKSLNEFPADGNLCPMLPHPVCIDCDGVAWP